MAATGFPPARIDIISPDPGRRHKSPITPATTAGVTGIVYPSPVDAPPRPPPLPPKRRPPGHRLSRIESVSSVTSQDFIQISDDIVALPQLEDDAILDDLWKSLRADKELKMHKEVSKVKSLEENKPIIPPITEVVPPRAASSSKTSTPALQHARTASISRSTSSPHRSPHTPSPLSRQSHSPPRTEHSQSHANRKSLLEDVVPETWVRTAPPSIVSPPPPSPPPPPPKAKTVKKKRSVVSYKTVPERNFQVAIFDLRGVDRDDIRVTYKRDHLIVSWEIWEVEDWEEEDCIARKTLERVYHRIIPLAPGTKFSEVYSTMKGEDMLLRYPLTAM